MRETIVQLYSPRFLCRARNIVKELNRICKSNKKVSILDAGCGDGALIYFLSKFGYYAEGLDINKDAISIARKISRENVKVADILNFEGPKYDIIICGEVLEHIEKDYIAMKNLYKNLKRNGYLIITVPNKKQYWNIDDELAGHVRRYEADELIHKLKKSGFSEIKIKYIGYPFINIFMKFYQKQRRNKPKKISFVQKIILKLFSTIEIIDDFFNTSKAEKILIIAKT